MSGDPTEAGFGFDEQDCRRNIKFAEQWEVWREVEKILHEVGGMAPHWARHTAEALMAKFELSRRDPADVPFL